ncbi:MAG: hypothetical protein QOI56_871 [Actinomycetota bacterium]|jgi:hypothetical protein|nr:hypothetical protein [Actinomycetota bacterium]
MHEQLHLLRSDDRPWRLDDHTREVGRRGIEEARAALHAAKGDKHQPTTGRLARRTAA